MELRKIIIITVNLKTQKVSEYRIKLSEFITYQPQLREDKITSLLILGLLK
jgi:hypothetical protein